ncbi:MAG: YggT family protein [Spirochaetaceae bacterium]|jgi:YggT family protein|nr:YggT family protein [Spirochaetaceae bacterium]
MNLLAGLTSLYLILILIRVLMTWFSGMQYGRPLEILCNITDPYLNWFQRFSFLRLGAFDFSPVVAMAILSVANNVFSALGRNGTVRLGIIIATLISAIWSAVSFVLGFCAVVLILRLIAYFANANIYSSFWRVIDSISQPILFQINHFLFKKRIVRYTTGIIISILVMVSGFLLGNILVFLLSQFLIRLPL